MAKTDAETKKSPVAPNTKSYKTFSQKPADVKREWILIDASTAPIGRIATVAANYLIGKSKVTYTPHVDGGDFVVIINAKQAIATGDKELAKRYFSHSGFPGSLKVTTLEEMRNKHPERIIELAVSGMLPKNKLRDGRMARLKVFADENHAHAAQKPKKVEVK